MFTEVAVGPREKRGWQQTQKEGLKAEVFRRLRQVQREICSPAETLCLLMAGPSRIVPPWGPNWRWTSALHLGNHRSFRVTGRLLSPPDEPMMLPFFSFRYEFVERKGIPTCDAGGSATQDGAGRNKKGLRPRASIRYLQVRDSIPRNSSCDKLQHPQHAQPVSLPGRCMGSARVFTVKCDAPSSWQ